ncbi:hypothetical protein BD626DRAFT_91055 [Schizophyllum amplum]|uniref:Uncharacterized protein n=1 Tax=Schizophyllum amplum TaxID=97359 RepID=A0A550C8M4_9AGAR|nr:hypothetical protein BD626DRAFT_91055 [Auriculariopsis ampla]
MIPTSDFPEVKRASSDPIQIPARGRKLRVDGQSDSDLRPLSPELLFEMSPPVSEFSAMRIPFAPSNTQNMVVATDEPQPLYSFPSFSILSRRNSGSGSPAPELKPRGRGRRTSSAARRPSLMRRPTNDGNGGGNLVRSAAAAKTNGFTPIVSPDPRPYRTRYPLYPMHTDCCSPPPVAPVVSPPRMASPPLPWSTSPWILPGRQDSDAFPGDDADSTEDENFMDFRDYLLACIENGRPLRTRRTMKAV